MLPIEYKAYSIAIKTALYAAPVGLVLALQADTPSTEIWRATLTVIGMLLLFIGKNVLSNQKKLGDQVEAVRRYQHKLDEGIVRIIHHLDPEKGNEVVRVFDKIMEEVRDN